MKANKMLLALVVTIIGLLPFSGHARGFEWEWTPKYVGEIHAGYKTTTHAMGMDLYSGMVELGTMHGVSLNKYLDIMVGVDAFMLTHYYKGRDLRFAMAAYLDLRPAYPITDKFKVFLDLGLGGAFNIKSDPKLGNGFFCQFGPGLRFRKFNLSLGLQSWGTGAGSTGFFTKVGLYF